MNKKGVALILISILLVVLTIFSTALISSSFSENAFAIRYLESTQAFWLAEAGISQAISGLRIDSNLTAIANTALGKGGYSATIVANPDGTYTVTSQGFIPFNTPFSANRIIQAVVDKLEVPGNFYDYVIWSENNINIIGTGQGNFGSVTGDVISGGSIYTKPENTNPDDIIEGAISTNDPTASPLPLLNFDQLRIISQNQGNFYDAERLKNPSFPTSFWYKYTETEKIPNIVFLEGNLVLSGGANVGGFFIVGGDSIYTTTITGNVGIDGCIYTPGEILVKGGGTNLNIDGAIWAGSVKLEGSITLSYNPEYMQATENFDPGTILQIISWKELKNPYTL